MMMLLETALSDPDLRVPVNLLPCYGQQPSTTSGESLEVP